MTVAEYERNQIKEHEVDLHACRMLWCAVITEQFHLAVSPGYRVKPHEIDAARRWFGSRDFFMVCALAGVDGAWLLERVRFLLREVV